MSNTLADALAESSELSDGILIQGERMSFHHRAVRNLLPDCEIVPVQSFPALAARLEARPQQLGLMAIENSVAGAILMNYLLLEQHGLWIVGEVFLRISHSLLALPGVGLAEVNTVESHPMALAQCRAFFSQHAHLRPVEVYDTAGSATAVAAAADRTRAALAPAWCAKPNGLQVLAKAVEDSPHNWTRFVLVRSGRALPEAFIRAATSVKTSIAFSVPHEVGSLARVLQVLAEACVSLTKIQSLPLVGEPWAYRFFVDFLSLEKGGSPSGDNEAGLSPSQVLDRIREVTKDLRHLGDYAAGEHHQNTEA